MFVNEVRLAEADLGNSGVTGAGNFKKLGQSVRFSGMIKAEDWREVRIIGILDLRFFPNLALRLSCLFVSP